MSKSSQFPKEPIVYIATHRATLRSYVGVTTKRFHERISQHFTHGLYGGASFFHRALRKYGYEAFDFAVLSRCTSREAMNQAEKFWISHLGTLAPNGFNLGNGGEGSSIPGHLKTKKWRDSVTSPEVRAKHSARMKSIRGTEEYRKRAAAQGVFVSNLRASLTPEERERWRINAANARRGITSGLFGDKNPAKRPDNRAKITAGQTRAWSDPIKKAARMAKNRATIARRMNQV